MATERYHAGSAEDAMSDVRFITGEKQVVTGTVHIPAGQGVLPQYSVLGQVTVNSDAILSLSAASDGSEVPKMILAYEVDATAVAVDAQVFMEGCFNPDLLIFGTGHDAASVEAPLQDRNIYLKAPA